MGVRAFDTTAPERVIRCVLWHARGAVLPGALVAALDRPQVQWKAWDSEYLALAEAMRFQGDALTRETPARVLVLVEPSRLHGVDEVLTVLERFRPRAPLWVFEGGPKPSLQGMSAAETLARLSASKPSSANTLCPEAPRTVAVEAKPVPQVVTRRIGLVVPKPLGARASPKSPPPPPLRLAGTASEAGTATPPVSPEPAAGPAPTPVTDDASVDARPATTLLTEEEIEMLLSDRPTNGKAPAKPGGNVR